MIKKNIERVLYIRADMDAQELIGGGSVAHTLGVLKGFLDEQLFVVCASTAMHATLATLPLMFVPLSMPRILRACGFKVSSLLSNVVFYFKLRALIRKNNINLIYQRYSMLNCVGIALAHCFNIPLYLEFNGSEAWMDEHWSAKRRLNLGWLMRSIEQLNVRYATKIVVVSQVLKEQLIMCGVGADKISVCPNGVDFDMFDTEMLLQDRTSLRDAMQVQEKFVFGFSGTFGPWHGVDTLAYIIPRICASDARAHFLLIGDGALRQSLYQILEQSGVLSRVTFTGMLPSDAVPAYLAMCDAFLCPTQPNADGTRFFGSPTKLFEYMAAGKPIIASDIEQVGQILRPFAEHLLVLSHDYEGFVAAAKTLLSMPEEERSVLGDAVRNHARASHTWQAHVRSFL